MGSGRENGHSDRRHGDGEQRSRTEGPRRRAEVKTRVRERERDTRSPAAAAADHAREQGRRSRRVEPAVGTGRELGRLGNRSEAVLSGAPDNNGPGVEHRGTRWAWLGIDAESWRNVNLVRNFISDEENFDFGRKLITQKLKLLMRFGRFFIFSSTASCRGRRLYMSINSFMRGDQIRLAVYRLRAVT